MFTKRSWKLIENVFDDKSEKRDPEYQKVVEKVIEDLKKYSGTLEIPRN